MTAATSPTPLYRLPHIPPYQINHRSKRSGKTISVTKRRILFQFGFASAPAIEAGLEGPDCRGQEHEVILIWSHVSGKRVLWVDGVEVHTSQGGRGNTKFTHSWGMGCHVLTIVGNATVPSEGGRQFDLLLDGMSFFEFKKIYELGSGSGKLSGVARAPSIETVPTQASSWEVRRDNVDGIEEEVDCPPVSELQIDVFEAPSDSCNLLETELPSPMYSSYSCQDTMALTNTFSSSYDEFSPVNGSFGASCQKSFQAISNEILTAYNTENYTSSAPPAQGPAYGAHALMASPVGATAPSAVHATYYMQAQDSANPPFDVHAPSPSNDTYMPAQDGTYLPAQDQNNLALVASNHQPNTSYSLEEPPAPKPVMSMYNTVPEPSVDDLTACMNKLVNFDDVSKPVKSSTQAQPDKNQSLQSLKWAMTNSGRAPTLSEIQSMKSTASSTLVMNNPQFYHQSQQQAPYTYASAY